MFYARAKLPLHRLSNVSHDLILARTGSVLAIDFDVHVFEAVQYLNQVLRLESDAVDDHFAYCSDRLSG